MRQYSDSGTVKLPKCTLVDLVGHLIRGGVLKEVHSVFSVNLPGALCGCTATTSPVVLLYRVYRVQILILQNLNSG